MAKWIKTNGDVIDVSPKENGKTFSLDELKAFVGGWIECVTLNDKQVMIVNEEGKLNGLPYNLMATEIIKLAFQPCDDFIVGDAILCNIGTEID